MRVRPGVKLLEEVEGGGAVAKWGDRVSYRLRAFLGRGDEVSLPRVSGSDGEGGHGPGAERLQCPHGSGPAAFRCRLGRRDVVAGLEYALRGMREGGYRKVKVSPHLAYGARGVPGRVPANAVMVFEIWLQGVAREVGLPESEE